MTEVAITQHRLAEAVNLGVHYLTERYGKEWYKKLDPDTLNLREGTVCVIGQVFGEFRRDNVADLMGREFINSYDYYVSAQAAGFYLRNNGEIAYDQLTLEWIRRIDQAKAADAPLVPKRHGTARLYQEPVRTIIAVTDDEVYLTRHRPVGQVVDRASFDEHWEVLS